MWLLVLFLLQAFNFGIGSECIDNTLRCTHRRVPFPTRKNLPETREALDKVCRDQNEYFDCLQNIPGDKFEVDIPTSTDKLNRLDAEYLLSELCTEGLKPRNNYLKQAACINKQKTDVCISVEFLIILLANEKALTRCSVQNKVTSCVSMMLAMNCGAEAGFLYRRLLHIANDGDVHCNAGEDLGEVFSVFKLTEENANTESDTSEPRLGEVYDEDSSDGILSHRVGEIEGADTESSLNFESSTNPINDEHVSDQPLEVDNIPFVNDEGDGMEVSKDWVLKTVYGRSQSLPVNANIDTAHDLSSFEDSVFGEKMCSPFELSNKKQTNIHEQCFDEMLENTESQDHIHENKGIYSKSDADSQMNVLETESITEMYANPSVGHELSDFQRETLIPDGMSLNLDLPENTQTEFTEDGTSESLTNDLLKQEALTEPRPLKDYDQAFYEQNDDLESENSYQSEDLLYLQKHPAESANEESSQSEVKYSTFDAIIGGIDAIGRNIYTITDIFDYGSNSDGSIASNVYLADEKNIKSVDEQDSKFKGASQSHFESEEVEQTHTAHDTLQEIVKRIGEIEVKIPVFESHLFETNKTNDSIEILSTGDASESSESIESLEPSKNYFQSAGDYSIKYLDPSREFSGDSFEIVNPSQEREYLVIEKDDGSDEVQIVLDSSESENNPDHSEESSSESITLINIEDAGSGYAENGQNQDFSELKQKNDSKVKYAGFSTDDNVLELNQNFEIPVHSKSETDKEIAFMYESGNENSNFADRDSIQDLNNYELRRNSDADFEDQYVTVQEYDPFEQTKDLDYDDDAKDLKFKNENKYFSKIKNTERTNFEELSEVNIRDEYASEAYEFVDPDSDFKLLDMDDEYSGSSGSHFQQSSSDALEITTENNLEDTKNNEFEETKTSTDRVLESLPEEELDPSENEIKSFVLNQPIVEVLDENVRKYYELKPHEPERFLLLNDLGKEKFDPSEIYYVEEQDHNKFRMQDVSDTVKGDAEKEILEPEGTYSEDKQDDLLRELDSYVTLRTKDVSDQGRMLNYDAPSRRSSELERTKFAHLGANLNSVREDFSQPETYEDIETSTSIYPPELESLELDEALNIFETADPMMQDQYLLSEEERDRLFSTQEDSDTQDIEVAYSDLVENAENPEEVIMNHLDSLLKNDATDSSSGDSTVGEDLMDEMTKEDIELEGGEYANEATNEDIFMGQIDEELPECHTRECQQLASNRIPDAAELEHDTYRIETNRIKAFTPYSEEFLEERLSSNKVHSSRDSIAALVNENYSQVPISKVKQGIIPCLQYVNVPGEGKSFECHVRNNEPRYIIY